MAGASAMAQHGNITAMEIRVTNASSLVGTLRLFFLFRQVFFKRTVRESVAQCRRENYPEYSGTGDASTGKNSRNKEIVPMTQYEALRGRRCVMQRNTARREVGSSSSTWS
jgi:hypothetical protein